MKQSVQWILAGALMALFLWPAQRAWAEPQHPWSVVAYNAIYTPDRLKEIFVNRHSYESSFLAALAVNREVARMWTHIGWELEGQVVKHYGRQDHMEFNALFSARWHHFPWNHRVATTLAVGEGVSWAGRKPKVETEEHKNVSQWLNYLLFELTLAPPQSRWYWSGRIHHRSGVFGLYNGVRGGSNFIGMGVGYRF